MKRRKRKFHPPASRRQEPTPTSAGKTKVPPPRNLTPALCDRLRRDLLKACGDVAVAHGLSVSGGDLSDIDLRHGFHIGFRVGIAMKDGTLYSPQKAMFEVLADHYGLQPSDHGRTFKSHGETFRITAINPNRPKYPISAERVADGRGFKFSAENVALHLRNSDEQSIP